MKLIHLLLIRRYPLQPRYRRDHRKQQVQLRVLFHVRLHEHRTLLRVEPSRDEVRCHLAVYFLTNSVLSKSVVSECQSATM